MPITNDEISRIVSHMRTVEFLRRNKNLIKQLPDSAPLVGGLEEYQEKLSAMINRLTEEERDRLLDQYDCELKALGLDKTRTGG